MNYNELQSEPGRSYFNKRPNDLKRRARERASGGGEVSSEDEGVSGVSKPVRQLLYWEYNMTGRIYSESITPSPTPS